jgi:serine protease
MRFAGPLVILAAGILAAPLVAAQDATTRPTDTGISRPETAVRLIVKLRASGDDRKRIRGLAGSHGTANRVSALTQRIGLVPRGSRDMGGDMSVVLLNHPVSGAELAATLDSLRTDPEVEFVEVDQRRYAQALPTPTDPLYADQWYLKADEASAVNFTAAWDLTTGSTDTVIAVLDTGVRYDHPDLGRLLPGYDFVAGESASSFVRANDGDGRDADPSDPGDWLTWDESVLLDCDWPAGRPVNTPVPSSWHGTRVAGIVGAAANNDAGGIAGATWAPRILPVRVLGKCFGYDSEIIAGMRWAAGLSVPGVPANPAPAKILNMSLGGSGNCSNSYRETITELTAAGILVVAAAGNEHGPVDTPANCPGVLAVAGLRHVGTKVGYSSLGTEVGISAPAGNCVTLSGPCVFPLLTTFNTGTTVPALSSYDGWVGTSFSAPIVSAIAGLMHALNDELGSDEMIVRIKLGARAFPAPDPDIPTCPTLDGETKQCNCTTTTCGAGMADAPGALIEALRPMARIADPGDTAVGDTISLDATASGAARGHSISAWQWSVAGGAAEFVGATTGATATLRISAAGTTDVQLTVTDDVGGTDTAAVTIQAAATGGGGGGGLIHPLLLAALLGAGIYRRQRYR